jgi:hypothetical protein
MSRMTAIFAGLVALALAGAARADVPALPFTLTTVDEFERIDDTTFSLTGLVSGETTPREMQLQSGYLSSSEGALVKSADACERAALMMTTHPGRFTLRVARNVSIGGGTVSCRLIRQQ